MKCPSCKHNLAPKKFKGVQIDECTNCHGMWFDKGELKKAKDNEDSSLRWLDTDLFSEKEGKHKKSIGKYICPKDGSEMTALSYMDSKVVVDKCGMCHGVWLDNKEFEKIIKYLEKILLKTTASKYEKEVVKEFKEIFTGSKSSMEEVKDFLVVTNLFAVRLQIEHPWVKLIEEMITQYSPLR